ncbi:MAG: prenyltransferase/squalene oxidase repeat-containing protein [Planctomycetota bacterium]
MSSYLQNLTIRLAKGIGRLSEETRQKHTRYFLSAQREDGGFGGREGGSDLYYTTFAMRGLSILGELYGGVADKVEAYLKPQLASDQTIVDFFSLFYAGNLLKVSSGKDIFVDADPLWPDQVAEFLEKLKRDDGGYAKAPEGNAGSTYHTFLVMLVYELIQRSIPDSDGILRFLESRRDEEGGWHEIRVSKRPGTNPTAAAVASLLILDAVNEAEDPELVATTLDFLVEMQTDEGGLRANTRIPIADLLSSFTGGLTLVDLQAFDEIDIEAYRQFVAAMERSEGGFQAAAWDDAHDVEYSFYGLGCLALLENH